MFYCLQWYSSNTSQNGKWYLALLPHWLLPEAACPPTSLESEMAGLVVHWWTWLCPWPFKRGKVCRKEGTEPQLCGNLATAVHCCHNQWHLQKSGVWKRGTCNFFKRWKSPALKKALSPLLTDINSLFSNSLFLHTQLHTFLIVKKMEYKCKLMILCSSLISSQMGRHCPDLWSKRDITIWNIHCTTEQAPRKQQEWFMFCRPVNNQFWTDIAEIPDIIKNICQHRHCKIYPDPGLWEKSLLNKMLPISLPFSFKCRMCRSGSSLDSVDSTRQCVVLLHCPELGYASITWFPVWVS